MGLRLLVAALAAAGAIWPASSAAGDVINSDGYVQVTIVGAVSNPDDGSIYGDAEPPVLQIQSLNPNVTQVECQLDSGAEAPCGPATNPSCSSQCTYSPPVSDGFHTLTVNYLYYGEGEAEAINFTTYVELPQTTLTLPLQPDPDIADPVKSAEYPQFLVEDPADPESVPVTSECMLTSPPSAAGQWGSCVLPRLQRLAAYELRARNVDIFGRADPAPPSYVFSPTPCRASVRGRAPTMAHILRHGLPVTVSCVQPGAFAVGLNLPDSYVSYWQIPSPNLGLVKGHTAETFQTVNLRVRMYRGIPRPLQRFLSTRGRVPLHLEVDPEADYGLPYVRPFRVLG